MEIAWTLANWFTSVAAAKAATECSSSSEIRDQGQGFDPNQVPDPLAFENLCAEHGRGIHLMKLAMDEISFERGGTAVRMRKRLGLEQKTCGPALRAETDCSRTVGNP
jgi:anti-sigma regulatory factor (Ser/Thr protein kinase)